MKRLYAALIIISFLVVITHFDSFVMFLLAGAIPGSRISLSPSTMLAIMVASTMMLPLIRRRRIVYKKCLQFYDAFFGLKKKPTPEAEVDDKPKLPRRRYQEL